MIPRTRVSDSVPEYSSAGPSDILRSMAVLMSAMATFSSVFFSRFKGLVLRLASVQCLVASGRSGLGSLGLLRSPLHCLPDALCRFHLLDTMWLVVMLPVCMCA